MPRNKALVTIAIGTNYIEPWKTYCYPGWRTYAEIHGYDIILVNELLDKSSLGTSRSPSWQRLLICLHPAIAKYESVVWMDADIVINAASAPCVVEASTLSAKSPNTLGVVLDRSDGELDPAMARAVNRRQSEFTQTLNQGRTFRDMYRLNGFPDHDYGFNAGVMVLRPDRDADFLKSIYLNYKQTPYSWLEAVPLAHHVLTHNRAHSIPKPFNTNAARIFYCHYPFLLDPGNTSDDLMRDVVRTIVENSYFTHFLGGGVVRDAMRFAPR